MAVYTNYAPPNSGPLKRNDIVIFEIGDTKLSYTVCSCYLQCMGTPRGNAEVFYLLGVNGSRLDEMAKVSYGYSLDTYTADRCWPVSKNEDYLALTRLVNAIYIRIKQQNSHLSPTSGNGHVMYTNTYRPATLKRGDTVVFTFQGKQYDYEVKDSHLRCSNVLSNNVSIFTALGLNKNSLAEICYGHRINCGEDDLAWPECNSGNMVGLCRLVNRIYVEISKKSKDNLCKTSYDDDQKVENSTSINLNSLNNGKTVKVEAIAPTIIGGEKIRGCTVPGRTGRTSISLGHLSYKTISG
jgi:hypothetical protein